MATFTWATYGSLMGRLQRLADPDATPLMLEWMGIIAADNKRGILAGTDKNDQPMRPVTYRPVTATPKRWTKTSQKKHSARGIFEGFGPYAAGFTDNLSTSQYRKLAGPPLAPRGVHSRIITNLRTQYGRDSASGYAWFAEGRWFDVVSAKGVSFLPFHFEGRGRLPVRDPRGVRAWGRQQAVAAMQRWGQSLLRGSG